VISTKGSGGVKCRLRATLRVARGALDDVEKVPGLTNGDGNGEEGGVVCWSVKDGEVTIGLDGGECELEEKVGEGERERLRERERKRVGVETLYPPDDGIEIEIGAVGGCSGNDIVEDN
jgi:hypothetical protein